LRGAIVVGAGGSVAAKGVIYMSQIKAKELPIRLYQSDNQFALAVPLAGREPEDILISIDGDRVTIRGNERGPRQHDLDLLKAEWSIGPFYREVILPESVDGSLANATYGNGVLVLTLPRSRSSDSPASADFTLETIGHARGEHIGHMGHDIQRTTTAEHRQRLAQIPRKAT
jgi:HSP20 family protein